MIGSKRPTIGVVIATYRRPAVLRSALACWLRSRLRPDQFLVVDASPDAALQRGIFLRDYSALFAGNGSDYLVATQPSTAGQRNQALSLAWTDVVAFADDESRPEPEYIDRILEVYACDSDGAIGGVSGTDRRDERLGARMTRAVGDTLRLFARSFGTGREQAFPRAISIPQSASHLRLRRVRDIVGCRMSFRRSLLAVARFDDRFLRYGLLEDLDVSIRIGRTHALVQRKDAFIQHEPSSVARIGTNARFLLGFVNPAYLTEKLFPTPQNRRPLDRMLALSRLRAVVACLVRGDRVGARAVIERFQVAAAMIEFLRAADPDALPRRFTALQRRIFEVPSERDLIGFESYRRWESEFLSADQSDTRHALV